MAAAELLASGKLRLDRPAPHVARLTITHPDKRNALDHEILTTLAAVVSDGLVDDVRCLVLTGEGPTFSAGYDLGALPADEDAAVAAAAASERVTHPLMAAVNAVEAFDMPTVAVLNGHAIGGGLELAVSCDLIVAADEALIGLPPVKLGLVYAHTGLRKFLAAAGAARTRELLFTGRTVSTREAHAWGLINEVVAPDAVAARGVELAAEIAANAPLALRGNKRVLRELVAAPWRLDPTAEAELEALREASYQTEDFREGVRAFADKRVPEWQGR